MKKVATAAAATCVAVGIVGNAGGSSISCPRISGRPSLPSKEGSRTERAVFLSSIPRGGGGSKDDEKQDDGKTKNSDKKKRKRKTKNQPTKEKSSSPPEQQARKPDATEDEAGGDKDDSNQAWLKELLKEEDYYKILGVSRTATSSQIQKGYRRRAVQTHPDKLANGDRCAFDKVAEAYNVLNDDKKRRLYNQYGKRGLESQSHGPADSSFAEDIFRSFFGASFSSFETNRAPRNRAIRYQLEVSLEELYRGSKRHISVDVARKPHQVEVDIEKGMASGENIVLHGQVNVIPNAAPGDLVFVLVQRPHPVFTRRGHDLAMELEIPLQEAICGVTTEIRHLDGRTLVISSARRRVLKEETPLLIQTGDVHVLKGEGMPKWGEDQEFGDLYIQYRVKMPPASAVQRLDSEERHQLGSLLEKLEGNIPRKSFTEGVRVMDKASPTDFGRASGPFRRQRDDHDDGSYGDDEDDATSPFGTRPFFWSSTSTSRSGFFGTTSEDDDDGSNVQCQQM